MTKEELQVQYDVNRDNSLYHGLGATATLTLFAGASMYDLAHHDKLTAIIGAGIGALSAAGLVIKSYFEHRNAIAYAELIREQESQTPIIW